MSLRETLQHNIPKTVIEITKPKIRLRETRFKKFIDFKITKNT